MYGSQIVRQKTRRKTKCDIQVKKAQKSNKYNSSETEQKNKKSLLQLHAVKIFKLKAKLNQVVSVNVKSKP